MAMSDDLFNLLPESLLLIILSMLPFKDVVKASVLSHRWNETIRSVPNIELHEDFFVKRNQSYETRKAQKNAFMVFSDSWIGRYRESLTVNRFSLKLPMTERDEEFVRRCISFAAQRSVKELTLDLIVPNQDDENFFIVFLDTIEFPKDAYELVGGTLEYLKLYSCGLDDNYLHHFNALRKISLGFMGVSNYCLRTLLSNCENLEILSLRRCWNDEAFDLGEDGIRLRKLVIDKCIFRHETVIINSPFLRVFKFSGTMYYFILKYQLPLLEEVELDFYLQYGYQPCKTNPYRLLDGLIAARVLTVCSYLLQIVPGKGRPLRVKRDLNVRHLILKTALHQNDYFGIAFMLNSCPWLEHLTIQLGHQKLRTGYEPPLNVGHVTFWRKHVSTYSCLVSTLKEVDVKGFKGSSNEVMALTYFITYGRVLQKMIVNVEIEENGEDHDDGGGDDHDEENHSESYRHRIAEILFTVPKASNDLEIIIV